MSTTAAPGLDLGAIAGFLVGEGVPVAGRLRAQLIEGGRSNLTFALTDDRHRWVLRRPPLAATTPSAHDMAREFRVMRALEATDVPVARTVALCEDVAVTGAPFTVVEYVEGTTIRTRQELRALDDDQVAACARALVGALAGLHRVDHRAVGLESFGRAHGYAARQLRRWTGQWRIVAAGRFPLAERLADRLAAAVPEQEHTTVVHGDFRIDNTLLAPNDPGVVRAVVDWELSTIGDPVADVALMCAYRHPGLDLVLGTSAAWTSDRLPGPETLAALYESASDVPLDHWEFHMGLAYYKLAVIAQGISHRFRAGATHGSGFESAGDSVAGFLEAGLSHVR
jgi:aminoglycoside phosphotransferase (APT) family kinase protein